MKKILAIIVACMYLAITSGLVLQIHYCMGKEVGSSVAFADAGTHACATCGMENAKNKCCHDEVKFVKLQDVHKLVTADYQFTPPAALPQTFNLIDALLQPVPDNAPVCNNSPPGDETGQPAIFLLHGVFRI
jgi:hypothetical protein